MGHLRPNSPRPETALFPEAKLEPAQRAKRPSQSEPAFDPEPLPEPACEPSFEPACEPSFEPTQQSEPNQVGHEPAQLTLEPSKPTALPFTFSFFV